MAMTPEGKVKRDLDKMLKLFGPSVFSYAPQAGIYGKAGIPDRVAVVRGIFVGIECKASGNKKPTAIQALVGEDIEKAGGYYLVVYDKKTIEKARKVIMHMLGYKQC